MVLLKLLLLIVLALDAWALADLFRTFRGLAPRVFWSLWILLLPIAGPVTWYYMQHILPASDPKPAKNRQPRVEGNAEKLR